MTNKMGAALLVALVLPAVAFAEGPMLVGGAFSISFAGGDFGEDAGTGYGFAAQGTYRFGERSLAFRVSGVGTWHGAQPRIVTARAGQRADVPVMIETRQHVFTLLGGPQLMRRQGFLRPYGYLLAGFAHFSALCEAADGSGADLGPATEIQDDVFAWSIGGGLLLPLGDLVRIDAGARYLGSSQARYPGRGALFLEGGELHPLDEAKLGQLEATLGLGFSF